MTMKPSLILYRVLFFILFGFGFYSAFSFLTLHFSREKIKVHLDENIDAIAIGHSHVECGLDDKYFPGLKNFGKSGEALYYGCLKAAKIVQTYPQVKTVFVELSANQMDAHMKNWICDEEHFQRAMKSYFHLLSSSAKLDFFLSFPLNYCASHLIAEKRIIGLLLGDRDKCNTSELEWGGYVAHEKNIRDSLQMMKNYSPRLLQPYQPNLTAILDLIKFCGDRGVKVVLIRVPVHGSEADSFESSFQDILRNNFHDLDFFDYRKMYLPDSCFLDREHLNADGARIFADRFYQDWMRSKGN
jgi:hypothetical protein